MANKHVEYFHSQYPYDLEGWINTYCSDHNLEPISISVFKDGFEYVAYVVVEDKNESN